MEHSKRRQASPQSHLFVFLVDFAANDVGVDDVDDEILQLPDVGNVQFREQRIVVDVFLF